MRQRSSRGDSQTAANGVENFIHLDLQHRRVCLIDAAVRPDRARRAQNDIVRAIRAIARWIRWTKESYGRSAQSDREMQRARIAAYDARGVAQESHQRTKRPIVGHRVGVTAAFPDGNGEVVFAGAVVHHATQAQRVANHFAEMAEAFGWPALRTPAAAWAQHDVAIQSEFLQIVANPGVVYFWNVHAKGRDEV